MEEKNFKRNMAWNALGNLVFLGCQWLITILVANLGSFKDAGLLSVAMSISATFQTISVFGIRSYQVSDLQGKYSDTCYVGFRLITCTLAVALCLVFSALGDYGLEQITAIALFMLFRLSDNFSDVLYGIAHKNGRLDVVGKSYLIKGPFTLAFFLGGYALTHKLNAALALMAVSSWCVTVFYDYLTVRRLSDFKLWQKKLNWLALGKETLPLCAYLFVSAAISTIPKLILEQRCGEEILGAYSSIFAPALLISTAAGYLYTPFVPTFARARENGDGAGFIKLFLKICAGIAAFAALTVAAALPLGELALKLLFGDKILGYTHLLIPILIAIFVNAVFAFLCTLSVVLRDFRGLLACCAAGLLSEVAVTGAWIDASGVNATSYGYILACALGSVMLTFRMIYLLRRKN